MLASFAAVLVFAVPASPPPTVSGCFGPCYVPGCPDSTFWVCHETPGKTKVYAESGGASLTSTQSNDTSFSVGVFGATIHPASPGNWGSVGACGDLHGDC
jgi:hypothetical protein